MKLLLDTHIAIWWVTDDPRLSETGRRYIQDTDNISHVSAASIWEIAIKSQLRRGHPDDMFMTGNEAIKDFDAAGFELVAVDVEVAAAIDYLAPLHGDPFDRLLVAHARQNQMLLLTHYKKLQDYGEFVLVI